jgi:hypothetical protein
MNGKGCCDRRHGNNRHQTTAGVERIDESGKVTVMLRPGTPDGHYVRRRLLT